MDFSKIKEQKERLEQLKKDQGEQAEQLEIEIEDNLSQSFNELAGEFITASDKLIECLELIVNNFVNKGEIHENYNREKVLEHFANEEGELNPTYKRSNFLAYFRDKEEKLKPKFKRLRKEISENWNTVGKKVMTLEDYFPRDFPLKNFEVTVI